MLEAVDWRRFRYLESKNDRGRPYRYSRVALPRALLYKELANLPSISELARILSDDYYKMNILGFDRLPSESTFSRFKDEVDVDHIMVILTGMVREVCPDFMVMVGVDSTSLRAYSRADPDAAWGYDHITGENYYGYKIHIMYDLPTLAPLCHNLTPANKHDITQLLPLLEKMGLRVLFMRGLPADMAYDSKEKVEPLYKAGVSMINRANRQNTKKETNKYRLQDYTPFHDTTMDKLYKNRMHCEYTNYLLKEHLDLLELRSKKE